MSETWVSNLLGHRSFTVHLCRVVCQVLATTLRHDVVGVRSVDSGRGLERKWTSFHGSSSNGGRDPVDRRFLTRFVLMFLGQGSE